VATVELVQLEAPTLHYTQTAPTNPYPGKQVKAVVGLEQVLAPVPQRAQVLLTVT